ncbi:MAG TPA: type II toxin-antitoxin system VapC family toxin [Devosia sp.]|nr:type II toxin-antitoxin system VapC family toxin [Devosia sp.]
MKYIDTSVFVSSLLPEENSARALAWLAALEDGNVAISPWVEVELSGALARKLRMGRITLLERENALIEFQEAWLPIATVYALDLRHFSLAREICDAHQAAIRPGDAIHLAIATMADAELCTFDQRFAAGAASLGYDVELIE